MIPLNERETQLARVVEELVRLPSHQLRPAGELKKIATKYGITQTELLVMIAEKKAQLEKAAEIFAK